MDRRFSAFTLSAFCFLVICVSALAQNAPVDPTLEAPSRAAEDTDVPEKLRDEAFDKHVDIRLLGPAIEDGDAGLLVDLALQTAHGEKVMQRKRKGIAAADIFTIAMRAAAASRDKAALKRIAQYAEKHQDAALKAKTTAALKLAGSSRSVKPDTTVSVEDVDAEKFAAYKALLNQIQLARIVGNRSWLVAMKDSLPEDYFHKGQRDFAVVFLYLLTRLNERLQTGAAGANHVERGYIFPEARFDSDDAAPKKRIVIRKQRAPEDYVVDVLGL